MAIKTEFCPLRLNVLLPWLSRTETQTIRKKDLCKNTEETFITAEGQQAMGISRAKDSYTIRPILSLLRPFLVGQYYFFLSW